MQMIWIPTFAYTLWKLFTQISTQNRINWININKDFYTKTRYGYILQWTWMVYTADMVGIVFTNGCFLTSLWWMLKLWFPSLNTALTFQKHFYKYGLKILKEKDGKLEKTLKVSRLLLNGPIMIQTQDLVLHFWLHSLHKWIDNKNKSTLSEWKMQQEKKNANSTKKKVRKLPKCCIWLMQMTVFFLVH